MRNPFKKKEARMSLEQILLESGVLTNTITKEQALNIPTLVACVDLISSTVASLPIKLYSETSESSYIQNDSRVDLLNDDTNDTLDGYQFKKAMVIDFLLEGGSYAYINRSRNEVKSLHYVDTRAVSVITNADPIFKKSEIHVNGESYREFEFIKLLRKTKDGVTGIGIIKENNTMLSVAYNTMVFEEVLVKTGGNKRGFLQSQGRLSKEAMDELKRGWKELYANNSDNVLVLNNGIDFKEASQSSVEMQLNENKETNSGDICKLFLVSPRILSGEASDEEYNNWVKVCILPILASLETALNKDLLLPSEKENRYFAFDTTELTKADIEKRFSAYDIAVKGGFMQIDEVRFKENLPPLKLNWIKMGLQDVLYFPKSEEIYTPNTNKLAKMGENPTVETNGGTDDGGLDKGLYTNAGLDKDPSESNDSSEGK